VAGLAILFGNYRGAGPKQELLPHLSEARTAKFAVKHVKYNGHDRTPCLIIAVNTPSTASVAVQDVNQITRSPKGFATFCDAAF
jgi:hypothetical protein